MLAANGILLNSERLLRDLLIRRSTADDILMRMLVETALGTGVLRFRAGLRYALRRTTIDGVLRLDIRCNIAFA